MKKNLGLSLILLVLVSIFVSISLGLGNNLEYAEDAAVANSKLSKENLDVGLMSDDVASVRVRELSEGIKKNQLVLDEEDKGINGISEALFLKESTKITYDSSRNKVKRAVFGQAESISDLGEDLEKQTRKFLDKHRDLGIGVKDLYLDKIKRVGKLSIISFQQKQNNLPVYGGLIKVVVSDNSFVMVDSGYQDLFMENSIRLSSMAALKIISEKYKVRAKSIELVIYPKLTPLGTNYFFAYKVDLPLSSSTGKLNSLRVFIDAKTGDILDELDYLRHEIINGHSSGRIYPDYPEQEKVRRDFGNEYFYSGYENCTSNSSGDFVLEVNNSRYGGLEGPFVKVLNSLYGGLEGPFVKVLNRAGSSSYFFSSSLGSALDVDWNVHDFSYKQEESNVFYHVNRAHDFFVSGKEPFNLTRLNFQVKAWIQDPGSCNAASGLDELYFLMPGETCEASSLYSDSVYHEYSHIVISNVAPKLSEVYWAESGNIQEAYADYFACTINNDSCINSFFYGMECLRDCSNNKMYPHDYGDEPHTGPEIISGAMWEIREKLGVENGDLLAMMALELDPQTFKEVLENFLIVDDSVFGDGSLENGSPNIDVICSSFLAHGVMSDYCFGRTENPVALIYSPLMKSFYYSNSSEITVLGTVAPSKYGDFQYYLLEYRQKDQDIWTLMFNSSETVFQDFLGVWNVSNLYSGEYILRLSVSDLFQESYDEVNIYIDKEMKTGWPIGMLEEGYFSSPIIADLDNDNDKEIVVAGDRGIYVFNADGSIVPGWPKRRFDFVQLFGVKTSPAVGDLDGDGFQEVIVASEYGRSIYAWNNAGILIPGWPVLIEHNDSDSSYHYGPSPALGDLDQDGKLEVVLGSSNGFLYVLNHNGSIVSGWDNKSLDGKILASAVIADVNGDNNSEIIIGTLNNSLYLFNADGSIVPGWPIKTNYSIFSSAVAGDIDRDGEREIVIGDNNPEENVGNVYIFNGTGGLENSWPTNFGVESSPALGDFKGDKDLEIFFSLGNGLYAWTPFGELVMHIPGNFGRFSSPLLVDINNDQKLEVAALNGNTLSFYDGQGRPLSFFSRVFPGKIETTSAIADLDNNGKPEIVSRSYWGVHVWEFNNSFESGDVWPMFQKDAKHTGCFDCDIEIVQCEGDVNQDRFVDVVDLLIFVENWDKPNYDKRVDFNRDGFVDVVDLLIFVENFGKIC